MIEIDVVNYLKNDSDLYVSLGASGSNSKIYPVQAPFGATIPYIVYNMTGDGSLEEHYKEITLSFDCIDDDFYTAKSLRDRLIFLLDRQDQIQHLITSLSYWFYWCKLTGGTSFVEPDNEYFHRVAIFDFKYAELSRGYVDMVNKAIPFFFSGIMVDEKVVLEGFYFQLGVTIKKISLHCPTGNEPLGADLTIDLLKNGAEQSRIATLSMGSNYETTDITDINYTTNDRLGIKIKSIGSIFECEDLTVILHYQ